MIPPLRFIATCGAERVADAATLPELLRTLATIDGPDDLAVWQGNRIVYVVTHDGRCLEIDGPMICWTWPPEGKEVPRGAAPG